MKICPICRHEYTDESLNFCLEDGSALGPGNGGASMADEEPATAVMGYASGAAAAPQSSGAVGSSVAGSVAVLPFVNMSADAENEYFCDGLAEELINALAKIDDLKVAARTAAFSFRGKNAPMGEIGRTLNVNSILEGSVRKSGSRVRITVQLVNAADGYPIWSERYDRDMSDIFEIQDEITLAVVDAMKVKLLGSEKQAVLRRHTNDPEAYQLYLRGRFFFYKRTPEGFLRAIQCFEKAIEIDPDYAVAISGLADSYVFLGFYEMVPPGEAAAKLEPLVERAYRIDPALSETNTSYALWMTLYRWEHRASLEYFKRAESIDPKYAMAYHLESAVAAVLGEHERALAAERRAIEIDPFTPVYNASLAWWYYVARRYTEAVDQCHRTIEIAPNHFFGHWVLGLTHAATGALTDSVVALQTAVSLNQFEQHARADLGRVLVAAGEREEAEKILADFEQRSKTEYVSPLNFAKLHLGLGNTEEFYAELRRAIDERAVRVQYLIVDPCVDELRDDPRFVELLNADGLRELRVVR